MKQTVEEAAKLHIGFPHDPTIPISAWEKGFVDGSLFGSAWQKEQTPYSLEQLEMAIDMARSPSWSKEELINYLNTGVIPD